MSGCRSRRGFTLVELTAVAATSSLLMSLFVPAIQEAREAARRSQCKNNLKQLGLAIHNYHEVYGTLPPGWTDFTPDAGESPRYGWSASILPFVDQAPLFKRMRNDFQQRSVTARTETQTPLPAYRCPSDTTPSLNPLRGGYATSNYSGNFGMLAPPRLVPGGMNPAWPGEAPTPTNANRQFYSTAGVLWLNSKVRFRDCKDGTSNILFVGERCLTSGSGIWMGVRGNHYENDVVTDCSVGNEINSGIGAFSSRHAGGAQFLFGDGAVRFISENIHTGTPEKPGLWQHLGGRADGSPLAEF